jgi:hypothetical protein
MNSRISELDKIKIIQLVEIIDECDSNIVHFFEMGRGEDSFSVKQERHLLAKYRLELNEILNKIHLEVSDTLLKAA